jgi:hypothetical protein
MGNNECPEKTPENVLWGLTLLDYSTVSMDGSPHQIPSVLPTDDLSLNLFIF